MMASSNLEFEKDLTDERKLRRESRLLIWKDQLIMSKDQDLVDDKMSLDRSERCIGCPGFSFKTNPIW